MRQCGGKQKQEQNAISKKIFLSFILFTLCWLVLEILTIALEPFLLNTFYQYDSDMGFRVRSHAAGSNKFGFNDRDYPLTKDANAYRIVFVGDSFSWAGGKEGNYTAILEQRFESFYGRHCVDVINTGYSMTHTGEQLVMLKKFGLKYNPDLVFLGFFAGNDFIDANPYRKRIVILGAWVDVDKRQEHTFIGRPLIFKSRLYHILKYYCAILRFRIGNFIRLSVENQRCKFVAECNKKVNEKIPLIKDKEGTFSEDEFLNTERNRLEFCNSMAHASGKFSLEKQYIFQSLREMRDLLKERKIGFIVGIYPDEFQVNEELLKEIFEKYHLRREDYDIFLMQKILKTFLDNEDIPYIDLLEDFKVATQKESLYKFRDTHWNDRGNDFAAEIIFNHLVKILKLSH